MRKADEKKWRAAFRKAVLERVWLERIQQYFKELGVDSSDLIQRPARVSQINNQVVSGSPSVLFRTRKYVPFTAQRHRWYPTGTKIVPSDVRLTPKAVAHWYWGDGGLVNNGYGMRFSTEGFTKTEVEFLSAQLFTLYGWHSGVYRHENGWVLVVARRNNRLQLASMIRPYCPPCFEYKLAIKDRADTHILRVGPELIKLRSEGWTQNKLAAHFGMTQQWVSWACKRLGA